MPGNASPDAGHVIRHDHAIPIHVYPLDYYGEVQTILLPRDPRAIEAAIEKYLVAPNMLWLRAHPDAPWFQEAPIRYGADTNEDWNPWPWMLRGGWFDCEDGSGAVTAEDRERRKVASRPFVYRNHSMGYHCVVERPASYYPDGIGYGDITDDGLPVIGVTSRGGILVDPSRAKGMR